MARQKSKSHSYDPKEFVKVWNTSDNPDDVARRFSMTKEQVTSLASQWRNKHGVFLKIMRKGPEVKTDWAELAKFSKQYQDKTQASVH